MKDAYINTKVLPHVDGPVASLNHYVSSVGTKRTSIIMPNKTPAYHEHSLDSEKYFDESSYIEKTKLKPGQDAYKRNKFNQAASDALTSNRNIPDTRNKQ